MKQTVFGCLLVAAGTSVFAQEVDLNGRIAVELNAAETSNDRCKLTFVITNGLGKDLSQAVYETVLFKTDGQVDRLTLFDFGALPDARPRVRQFEVPDMRCEALGRVLFNGAHACTGNGVDKGACAAGILPSSRTTIEVLG